jgi:hypothetical protein
MVFMEPLGSWFTMDLWPSGGTTWEIVYRAKRWGCIMEVEELLLLRGELI